MRLLCLALLAACGTDAHDPDAVGPDAGLDAEVDAAPAVEPEPPALPASPELPRLTPCPEGWRAVAEPDDARVVRCEAWPEEGPAECGAGEAHWPGAAGCERVGPACSAGDWGADWPDGAVVSRVRSGAPGNGDGSEKSPFGSIAAALAVAAEGTIVALAPGVYAEAFAVPDGVTVWGACTAETILLRGGGRVGAAVTLARPGGALRHVTVRGPGPGIAVQGEDVELEGVVVEDADEYGVTASGRASLRAFDLVIRDTVAGQFPDAGGAFLVTGDAEVTIERCSIERSQYLGIHVDGGVLTASDLAVRDARGARFGLVVRGGAHVAVERVAFDQSLDNAIFAEGGGTLLEATDLAIRDTAASESSGVLGAGLVVEEGARTVLTRASVVRSTGTAVVVEDPLAEIEATDLVVTSVRARPIPRASPAVVANRHAVLALERVGVLGGVGGGLAAGEGARVVASDVIVADTRRLEAGAGADGITLFGGARVELLRAEVSRCPRVGVFASGLGTELHATDLTVRDGGAQEAGNEQGEGVLVNHGARATFTRLLADSNRTSAIEVRNFPAELTATDVTVRSTRSRTFDGQFGVGLWVLSGARAAIARGRFQDGQAFGIVASDPGSFVQLEDLVVDGVAREDCASTTCAGAGAGIALSAVRGGALEARRFLQRDAALCGVQIDEGTADLHEGEVRGNPIGASVRAQGYDLGRLQDRVYYLDNERNLDASELPIPDPTALPDFGEAR